MPILRLKFAIRSTEPFSFDRRVGPLFHRWLPNGETDALVLQTDDPNASLRVWTERRGYVRDGQIEYDLDHNEIDPAVIPRQGVVDGGYVFGRLEITDVQQTIIDVVEADTVGDETYVALGKRVVKLLHPPLSRFFMLLKTNFGQYWIRELEKWDSRKSSLGSYCDSLNMKWSLNESGPWRPFIPDQKRQSLTVTVPDPRQLAEFLTETDWRSIPELLNNEYEPTTGAKLLIRTYEYVENNDAKNALIEGVTALEVAVSQLVRTKLKSPELESSINSFLKNSSTQAQLIGIATGLASLQENLNHAINAINLRDKVIHEGWNPSDTALTEVRGLIKAVSTILGSKFKFPHKNAGNIIMNADRWEQSPSSS